MKKENSILKVLAYFNQFNYPVSKEEILFFLDQKISAFELSDMLVKLKESRLIFQFGPFYSLQNNASLYERRIKGNEHAASLLVKAYQISKFLFSFPFVRGVCISGSLSKNFADENADIDFFIITKSNRLWIARTLMHLFKKTAFLTGRQHLYCMNYYIDEEALQIEEKNEFTAMEMFTLLPACGNGTISEFFRKNEWVNFYYPNYNVKQMAAKNNPANNRIKKMLELLFDNRFGYRLENYLMNLTNRRWKKKELKMQMGKSGRRIGLKTGTHFCKPNPDFLQKKILNRYHTQLNEANKKFEEIIKERKSAFLN